MGSWIGAVGALVAAAVAVAGGGQPHHPGGHNTMHHHRPGVHASPTPPPTPTAGGGQQTQRPPQQISVPLTRMPQGTVTLVVNPQDHHVQAQLNMYGLAPGTQHRLALYANGNPAQPAFTFPDLTVDGSGRVTQTVTSNEQAAHGLPQIIAVRVDLLPGASGPSQQIAAAERVAVSGGQTNATLTFQSTIGQPGHAQLSYDPATHKLTVSLSMSGLTPGSRHAAHIHTGSCQIQGPVAYMLPDLVADPAGVAFERTTFSVNSPPPASGWYLNVHDGNMNDILQNGQPGPLFQPLACGNVQTSPSNS